MARPAGARDDRPVLDRLLRLQWFDESGLGIPIAMEELLWATAGIGVAIVGTTLAAASVATGTDEQVGQWIPGHSLHG